MSAPQYEATTTIRRPRMGVFAGIIAISLLNSLLGMLHVWQHLGVVGPILSMFGSMSIILLPFALRFPSIRTAKVQANAEGLRVGDKLLGHATLKSALVRHEKDKTYVRVQAKRTSVDVEVPDDAQADALTRALELDAKSTASEFRLFQTTGSRAGTIFAVALAMFGAGMGFAMVDARHHGHFMPIAMATFFTGLLAGILLLGYTRMVKLFVGADGIVVKRGFSKRQFFGHDEIRAVRADEGTIVVEPVRGSPMRFSVSGRARPRKREDVPEVARSIVRRIGEAREAFTQLADAPDAALALARGERSVREWLDALKRLGEGAAVSFRNANVSREQLLRIVESTSAAAKERLAAIVALRSGMTEEEKPRVRVAAERCVLPALRERMVRIAEANDDDILVAELEATDPRRA